MLFVSFLKLMFNGVNTSGHHPIEEIWTGFWFGLWIFHFLFGGLIGLISAHRPLKYRYYIVNSKLLIIGTYYYL